MRLGFKGETQVADQLTGYGQWEYQIEATALKAKTTHDPCGIADLKFRMWVLSTTVVTTALFMAAIHGPTYCQNSVATPHGSDNFMQQRGNASSSLP